MIMGFDVGLQYLDENKQLILAILDNQNLGKLNECASYQAKLQQNLMYLAAIADAQPQAPSAQMGPGLIMQPGQGYMTPQSYVSIAPRGAVHFNMSPLPAPAHESFLGQQGFVSGQEAMELRKIHLMTNEPFMAGGNGPNLSGGFAEYGQHVNVEGASGNGQSGSGLQGSEIQPSESGSRQLQQDISVSSSDAGVQTGSIVGDGGQTADELEPSYLKASDDEGS
ncbi:hypothetical protein CY35_15G008200 [Sphagnum magellanicum]|nr:hypothetical protein CY35_15G008200 [Sphagnum magellanicum]